MVGSDVMSLASQKTDYTSTTDSQCPKRNFFTRYGSLCKKLNTHPLKEIKPVGTGPKFSLDLMVDKIKFSDWTPIVKALANDRSLHSLTFKSRIQLGSVAEDVVTERGARELKKGLVLFTTYMLQKFTASCVEILEHSDALRLLQLENIPLPTVFSRSIAEGVAKTCGLQKLLLVGCQLGDEGCRVVAESLRKVPSIHTLDLSGNDITHVGAKDIAKLIKFQGITRYNECWKHSLRAREVNTEVIPGLRRFSINDNHEVTDRGLKYIVEALADDNWIKAIDMQKCGITERGCLMVSKLLETNKDIVVFDLRKNNVYDIMAIPSIMNQLNDNKKLNDGNDYKWIFISNSSASEDSSSGGASSGSYNLAYTNEKVAKYIQTTVNVQPQNPVRQIQSDSTLKPTFHNPVPPDQQPKSCKPVQRSASSIAIKPKQLSKKNPSETSVTGVRKRVTSPAPNSLAKVNAPAKLANQIKPSIRTNPQRKLSLDQVLCGGKKTSSLKSTKSELAVQNGDAAKAKAHNSQHNQKFSKMVVREGMLKQTLEVEKTCGKSSGAEHQPALDPSGSIEHALEELFKNWENSNSQKPESTSLLSQITQGLTPSLSLEDFKVDGNKKPNRRIKETKKVCCLYFNRLEDGYEE